MKKIMIGIPSATGMIPLRVMSRLIQLDKPKDTFIDFGYVERLMIDKARNGMVQQCLMHKCDYLFFHDDDQIVPRDILVKLVELDKDIIGTPISSRNGKEELAVFDFKYNKINDFKGTQRVGGIGMGATLIKRSALEKIIDKYPAPFQFSTELEQQENGSEIVVEFSEDVNFCRRASELGLEVWCTDSVKPVLHIGLPMGYFYENGEYKAKLDLLS